MTRKLKRPIAFLSAFAMVLTLLLYLPGSVMTDFGFGITASAYTEGYLRYDISEDEGCIYITEYFGREETVTVPSMIAGKPIYGINSNAFKNASSVKTIYLPETVGYIDDNAFSDSQTVMISVSINTDGNLEFSPLKLSTERNKPYSITISAVNGYSLPSSITVLDYTTELVQGTDYTYNSSTGELTVNAEHVNTSLEIIAKGKKIESAKISFVDYYATTDSLNPVIIATANVDPLGNVSIPVSTIETDDENYNYAYYWQYVERDGNILVSEEVDIDEYEDFDEDFNDITCKKFVKENAIAGMEYFVYVVRTGKLRFINYYVDGTYANNTLKLSPTSYNYGNDITYATVPAKEGYEFDGWYFNADYSGEKFTTHSVSEYKDKYSEYNILKVYGRYVQQTHSLIEVTEKEATCTEDGNRAYYKCTKCNKLFSDKNGVTEITFDDVILPNLGHSFRCYVSNNDATCTGNGTETAKCNRCDIMQTREEADSALGHSFTSYVSDNNATCTKNGTETAKCDRCDITHTREEADSALGHSFTNYVSNNDATCTENGTETAKCDRCDKTDTRDIADSALGHSFTNYVSNNDATCTKNGTETAECDNGCDETDTRDIAGSALGHSFTNYVSNNDATCTKNGTETAECDNGCDETDTREEADSALGHDHSGDWLNNTADHWKVCDRADCTEILDKANHDYDEGKVTTPATEETEGVRTYTCETCGYEKTEPVAKLNHTHKPSEDYSKDKTGHWHACSGCEEKVGFESHKFDEGKVTTPATEKTEGVMTYTCETCGYTKTETIPVLDPSNPDVPDIPEEPSIPDDPAEKVNSFVERLYQNVLGRSSDESKTSHIDNLNNGETATKVAYDFVFSPEFTELDISNAERVTIMYNTFLDRDPDPAGLETWTKALDNGCSIGHIFYGFTQSGEFGEICSEYGIEQGTWEYTENRDKSEELTSFVSRLYTKALNRKFDVDGLNDHTGTYLENHDLYQLAYNFIFSPEFIEKDLSDEDFVDTMYRTFFDREGDPDGRADWLGRMKSGMSREQVLAGFVGSQECAELVARFGI